MMKKIFLSLAALLLVQFSLLAQGNVQATLTPAPAGQSYQTVIRLKNSSGAAITGNISSFTVGIRIPDQGANNPTLNINGLNNTSISGTVNNNVPAVVQGGYAYYLVAPNFGASPFAMAINEEKDALGLAFRSTGGTTTVIPSVEMVSFLGGNPPGTPNGTNYQMEYYVAITGDRTEAVNSFYASASSVDLNNAGNPKVVGIASVPLSVTWLSFTAGKAADKVMLNWATATERGNTGFDIERSNDGKNFSKIGFVSTQANEGNSNARLAYSFIDSKPLNGVNHYRLKQIDIDGKSSLSEIKVVAFTTPAAIEVYPNPANGATVRVKGSNISNISVFNITGQQVSVPVTYGVLEQELQLSGLASGNYVLRVATEGNLQSIKLVVQH